MDLIQLTALAPEPYKLTKGAAKLRDSINEDIEAVNAAAAPLMAQWGSLPHKVNGGPNVPKLDDETKAKIKKYNAAVAAVLRKTGDILGRICGEWHGVRGTERANAMTAAEKDIKDFQEQVREKLIELVGISIPAGAPDPRTLMMLDCTWHPGLSVLKENWNKIRAILHHTEDLRELQDKMHFIENALEHPCYRI